MVLVIIAYSRSAKSSDFPKQKTNLRTHLHTTRNSRRAFTLTIQLLQCTDCTALFSINISINKQLSTKFTLLEETWVAFKQQHNEVEFSPVCLIFIAKLFNSYLICAEWTFIIPNKTRTACPYKKPWRFLTKLLNGTNFSPKVKL